MLAKHIIRQFLTQILGLVVGFFISIITTRILGAEGRGDFALILNTASFLGILLSFSFGSTLIHVISSNKAPLRNTINTVSGLVFLLILVCAAVLLFFPFSKFNFFIPSSQYLLFNQFVLIVLFSTTLGGIFFNSILNGKKIFRYQQTLYFWIAPLSLITYIFLYYFRSSLGVNFKFFILFYLIINSIPTLGAYIIYLKHARPAFSFSFLDRTQLKYILNLSFLAYMANIFQFLSYRMDFWFVQYYWGSKHLGIYSLSVNLVQMLWLLPQAIATIFIAYSGAGNPQVAIDQSNRLCRITLNIIMLVSLILVFSIYFIIPFLYGHEFVDSVFLFQILLIGIVPFCLTTIISSYFAGKGLIKINLICSFIGFLVCLIFDFLLVPKMGNKGAAIATIISYFTSTVCTICIYINQTKSSFNSIILIRKEDIVLIKSKLNIKFLLQQKN